MVDATSTVDRYQPETLPAPAAGSDTITLRRGHSPDRRNSSRNEQNRLSTQ